VLRYTESELYTQLLQLGIFKNAITNHNSEYVHAISIAENLWRPKVM